ncbi:MAG: Periplasmic protein involved in polysaccharide export [Acidobacteria bacterium]|jgi:protein involved in polysaccharide export with SLBB domain|nr:Periplasmic protein involved in polysaccharide export [Acidobacteriota bacterium]
MKYRKLFQFAFIFVCMVFSRTLPAAQTSTASDNARAEENLVHYGDLIDVDIIGSFDYDWRGRLTPEGFIDGLNFNEGPIFGLCKTEEEIALAVAQSYGKLLRDPKVVVRILDRSNRATSLLEGAVKKPQRFQIKRKVFLNELLIVGGGLTETANGEIRIFRPQSSSCGATAAAAETFRSEDGEKRERFVKTSRIGDSTSISIKIPDLLSGDKESNPQILSGDIITVLEAEPVYVIGGVNNPRQIAARSKLTLTRAIDSAGGLAKNATEESVTVFRRKGGETKVLEIDLNKVKAGQEEDLVLQGFDVIDVGEKGRAKKKNAPIIQSNNANETQSKVLPLRIID